MADPQQMQTVTLTDGRTVNFPAGMSKDDMASALSQLPPKGGADMSGPGEPQTWGTVGQHLLQIPEGILNSVLHPIDTAHALLSAQLDQFSKARDQLRQAASYPLGSPGQIETGLSGLAHGAAGAIPLIGPAAANAGEELSRGDFAGGLTDTATTLGAGAVGKGVQTLAEKAAPAVMEFAQRVNAPIARKFDNLGQTAVDAGILPTDAGAAQAQAARIRLQAVKEGELRAADAGSPTGGGALTTDVRNAAAARTDPQTQIEIAAGLRQPTQTPQTGAAFVQNNPPQIPAYQLDAIKGAWDNASDATMKARAMGRPVTADDAEISNLSAAAKEQLRNALPAGRYDDLNQQIMNMEGVRQVSQRTADIPTNGLANLSMAVNPSLATAAFRLARVPAFAGGAAIGLDRSAPALSAAVRAAIMAQLQKQSAPTGAGGS